LKDEGADILARIAAGDNRAVALCVEFFGPLVQMLARRVLVNRSETEDAVSEVFAEIWRCAGRYDPAVASSRAFVAMIARRRLIDRGRKEQSRIRGVAPIEAAQELGGTPGVRVDDDAARASAALSKLPEREREMVRMAVGYGWSQQRIADEFAMPIGTVKTTLRRVMGELRAAVEGGVDAASEVRA
jgi:RNA polymerase sigma factor (sigma-70 family)